MSKLVGNLIADHRGRAKLGLPMDYATIKKEYMERTMPKETLLDIDGKNDPQGMKRS